MNEKMYYWVAIMVLGLLAAFGNIQYFKQQTKMQLAEEKLHEESVQNLANVYNNEDVKKTLIEAQQLKDELSDMTDKRDKLDSELTSTQQTLKNKDAINKSNEDEIKSLKNQIADLNQLVAESQKSAADNRSKAAEAENNEKDITNLKGENAKLIAEKEQLERDKQTMETANKQVEASAKKRIQELQKDKANLLQTITQKSDAIRQRSALGHGAETDGKILNVDLANRFCVLDLGSVNNVRRGMRFEVVRWAMNDWQVLGTVEIRKVNYSTSDAIIVDKPAVIKQCPLTGYVARNPEEVFSPYAVDKEGKAVALLSINSPDESSMSDANPIIAGDKIRNPLYERDKKLKFAFAGEPVVFSEDILKNRIVASGNIFQEKVDIDTDFLILGRVDETTVDPKSLDIDLSKEEGQKQLSELDVMTKAVRFKKFAEQCGIPIMREVELNAFLR